MPQDPKRKAIKEANKLKVKKLGRPTDYNPNFHPKDFIDRSKNGDPVYVIASEWGINVDTIYEWRKKYPIFSDAYKEGREHASAWWFKLGKAACVKKMDIDLGFFVYLTKCSLKWNDRPVQQLNDEDKVEEIELKITKYTGEES